MADYNLTSANSGPALDAILEKAKTSLQPGAVTLADVTGLDTALAGKSDTTHTHTGTYQPADADLTAIAGLTSAADKVPYFTGAGTADLASLTQAGRAVIAGADAAAQRSALGLGTSATMNTGTVAGTVCAGNDARLSDARTPAAHTVGSHSDWPAAVSVTEVGYLDGVTSAIQTQLDGKSATGHTHTAANISDATAAGRAVLTAADAGTQRTAMGLLDASTHASTDFATAAQGALASSAQQPNAAASFLETVIAANSATTALRVTQTGAGDVVRFEDAANPDSTPFVIDANGNVAVGVATPEAKCHVVSTTEQLRLGYDATKYASLTVDSNSRLGITGSNLKIGIGNSGSAGTGIYDTLPITGAPGSIGYLKSASVKSDVTLCAIFQSSLLTEAAAFTLSSVKHFVSAQGTIGSGSTVTAQYGFAADSSLAGAGKNVGFLSSIASGTDNWNLYADGTAPNYFSGHVGIGTSLIGAKLHVVSTTDQLRLGYDATKYVSFTVNSSGFLEVAAPLTIYKSSNAYQPQLILTNNANDGTNSFLIFQKIKASFAVVAADKLGAIEFKGFDGTSYPQSAGIYSEVDGTVATNNVPSRLRFATTAAGGSITERMRIMSSGLVSIGNQGDASAQLHVSSTTEQLRLGYDATHYASFVVDGNGQLAILSPGTSVLTLKNTTANKFATLEVNSTGDIGINPNGVLKFGIWTTNADAAVNGYITIKDAAGNTRKLATIA